MTTQQMYDALASALAEGDVSAALNLARELRLALLAGGSQPSGGALPAPSRVSNRTTAYLAGTIQAINALL